MEESAIKVEEVGKKYTIGKKKDGSLRGTLASIFKRTVTKGEDFWALRDLSFEVMKGDVIGIIGKNGAGKSTLLKVLSQITKPTEGRIEINGRVASLLEVGTGFHPELTGRENIFLNGTILGMTRKEVTAKFDEIVEFSGIRKFIDTPVKRYSSGQYVRLAFAVAAHLEPEILIIDEVLAVGDAEFQKKCLGKMKDVAGEGRTVIFVSHNIGAIRQLCTKSILLDNGKLVYSGKTEDAIKEYKNLSTNNKVNNYICLSSSKDIFVSKAKISTLKASSNDDVEVLVMVNYNINFNPQARILIRISNHLEQVITTYEKILEKNNKLYKLIIEKNTLTMGEYDLNIIVYHPAVKQYDNILQCCHFEVINNNTRFAHLEDFNIGNIYSNEKWINVE